MTYPEEPRWGDPQLPPADPRSPEWRDPAAQPWWGNGATPPPGFPQSPVSAGPPPGPRRTKLVIALGAATVLIIVLAIALVATRGSSKPTQSIDAAPVASNPFPNGGPIASTVPSPDPVDPEATTDPGATADPTDPSLPVQSDPATDPATAEDPVTTTKAYYADLAANRSTTAWNLLCDARQQLMPLAGYQSDYAQDVATGTGIKTFTQNGAPEIEGINAAVPGTLVLADKESVPITVILLKESAGWRVCGSDLGGVLPNPGTGSAGGSVTT